MGIFGEMDFDSKNYGGAPPAYSQQPVNNQAYPQQQQPVGSQPMYGETQFQDPNFGQQQFGVTTVTVTQKPPLNDIFDAAESGYMEWCCYQWCCAGLAMRELGSWLKDSAMQNMGYLIVWLIIICLEIGEAFVEPVMIGMAESSAEGVTDDTYLEIGFIKLAINGVTMICSIIMVFWIVGQRRKFLAMIGITEDNCSTWLLAIFCSPCMYGQMGAYKKKLGDVQLV